MSDIIGTTVRKIHYDIKFYFGKNEQTVSYIVLLYDIKNLIMQGINIEQKIDTFQQVLVLLRTVATNTYYYLIPRKPMCFKRSSLIFLHIIICMVDRFLQTVNMV